ncbi:glycosyltransferase family 4 protein [Dyadobacter fermentans]|uniref:Glycosyl transferase group 1 n=1 Tax=Dyadobacter fermentans (strain ATCC 700827 / DSM 18053 / CIP 107007 / KCTC 52180 / NS114) TaxID=471854 RepID=C6VUL6_DYAFD|nr:glycosyltransferase family 4 protein [Dyadobacter fermentans]ACT91325.1 glycosyl transferase group 1 [Dyadobacter fermentans DSM 18053]
MKIIVTGTRGIPNIQGGVETHCQEIFPLIADAGAGHDVTIIRRSGFVDPTNDISEYQGVKIVTLFSPRSKSLEAFLHTFLSVVYAAWKRPDILHIHAVGPSIMTPFARLLGLNVVMTHHGPDYERKKWGNLAKKVLQLGEQAGVRYANKVIVISEGIGSLIERKYNRSDFVLIPNGVPTANKNQETDYLESLGLKKGKYIFTLGRFVPEKGFDYLIQAYLQSNVSNDYKLVIAGDADHESPYSSTLKDTARKNGIVLTGFIKGEKLYQLYTSARLFILPSFYEGLPISLLEAMSYQLDILASDIDANKEVCLPQDFYFEVGNIDSLAKKIREKISNHSPLQNYDMSRYDWAQIARQTLEVYERACGKR